MTRSIALRTAFAFGTTLALAACGGSPAPAPAETPKPAATEAPAVALESAEAVVESPDTAPKPYDQIVIGVMPKLVGIDYFNATETGAKKAADELGVKVDFNGPAEPDVTKQAQLVETWITKKYDAIAIAPNDPDAISIALAKARKRGIKVLTWDTDAQADSRDWFVNQCSSESIAKTLVDIMAEGAGSDAKYLMVIGTLTASNQNTWMNLANAYAKATYPAMTNLSETPKGTEEDQALATQVAIDSLKAYPDMNGMFALTSVALPGAAEGLRKSGAADKVFLTGLSTPKTMREYVKDGTVKKFALWNPEDLGYLAVYAAAASVRGELAPGATTFKAGHLGEVSVSDAEILLGDPLVFDAGNIDNYNF